MYKGHIGMENRVGIDYASGRAMGRAGESNAKKCGTTVIEKQ